jgi:hypothetical protein
MSLHKMIVDDEAWNMEKHNMILERHPPEGVEPDWLRMTEIVVPTERDKAQLLAAFEYLHDNRTIDTDFMAVNLLVHTYMNPELIKVRP